MTTSVAANVNFARILVPTDFTDISQRAIGYARNIARFHHSKILLAHANPQANPIIPPESIWFQQLTEDLPSTRQLERSADELNSLGFEARPVSLTGVAHEEIIAAAERERADLVVLGTHARAGFLRWVFGSEAEGVYRHASCPILVIGPEVPSPVNEPWPPQRIVCASDLDPASAPIAAYAHQLARQYGATVTLFQMEEKAGKAFSEEQVLMFDSAVAALIFEEEDLQRSWHAQQVRRGLAPLIASLGKEHQADLIVMGARSASDLKLHLPAGIAPQVIAKATCPVMIIPAA